RLQLVGDDQVQCRHGRSAVVARPHGTELELISCKGKWRRTVSVGVVEDDLRDVIYAQLHVHVVSFLNADIALAFELVKDIRHLRPDKDRHDRRWRFCPTQAMIVARRGDACPEEVGVFVYSFDGGHEKGEEHEVVACAAGGRKQVHARIGDERPGVMLAASVYAFEWLFVEQHAKGMTLGHPLHEIHHELVVVVGDVATFKDGGHLKL